jgi:argininosuccinate lyase
MPALHAFDKAHIVMLVEEKLLTQDCGAKLLQGLRKLEGEGVTETRMRVGGGLHSGEQYLIRLLGEDIGGRMHVARSSGDLSSVSMNITQRGKLLELMRAVNKLRRVLIGLAREHTGTILPGYSFGQQAQPMTLAHLWLSWAATLARVLTPARHHGRINRSAAGAIMVGSGFRSIARYPELLGFDAVHETAPIDSRIHQ